MTDHRQAIAGVFDRAAPTYDSVGVEFFGAVGRRVVELAELRLGERVLDVGSGRGASLFPAAEAVGPVGGVTGIDFAPAMVALTLEEVRRRGLAHVEVEVMDAQEPRLPQASYDVVLASLVAFFLPDPVAGLRAWRAATRPDGRLVLTTFSARDDDRWAWLEEVLPMRDRRASQPDEEESSPFDTAEGVHALLLDAGWVDASSADQRHEVTYDDPDQWLRWSWSHGMRMFWERVPADHVDAARELAVARLQEMVARDGKLSNQMDVRYTTASAGPLLT